ncbi:MAG: putative H(+)/Cl(-) exchange transporter [Ilumatobacteraceae bacterium]|nr:putative H(+)/Cl(-) exchange transporter [Ilumatobacteraceae bacterium]
MTEAADGRSRRARANRFLPVHRRQELRTIAVRSRQLVLLAAATGLATGLVVALFDRLVVDGALEHVLRLPLWLIAVLPGCGLLVAAGTRHLVGRRPTGAPIGPGTADEYLHAFHDPAHALGWRAFVARMIAAVATLGSGAPMGLEGPSLYTGATIGWQLERHLPERLKHADRRVLLVAGAAAGVSAIFKAPATGAVFALEVPFQGDLARRMLLPALVSSATGYLVFAAINGTSPLFPVLGTQDFVFRDLLGAALIGLLAGVGARVFASMLRRAKRLAVGPHPWLLTIAAGLVVAGGFALGRILTGESLMIGPGYQVLTWAADPSRSVWVVLALLGLRCLATSATVAGGGVGGLFVPLVVAGALTGVLVGHAVNRADLGLFTVIGVAAFLGAGYRVPLAAVMFVAETTGRPAYVVPGLIAAVVAELVMGDSSITSYQRHTPEFELQMQAASPQDRDLARGAGKEHR